MNKVNLGKFKINVSDDDKPVFINRVVWGIGAGLFINYKGDELKVIKGLKGYKVQY